MLFTPFGFVFSFLLATLAVGASWGELMLCMNLDPALADLWCSALVAGRHTPLSSVFPFWCPEGLPPFPFRLLMSLLAFTFGLLVSQTRWEGGGVGGRFWTATSRCCCFCGGNCGRCVSLPHFIGRYIGSCARCSTHVSSISYRCVCVCVWCRITWLC